MYCSCCFQNIFSFYGYSYINLARLYLWLTLKLTYHIIAAEPEEEESNAGAVAAGVVLSLLVVGIIVAALYFFK